MIYGNKTIQYAVYDRTSGTAKFVDDTTTVTRPNLEMLTDTLKGAGVMGEIDMPTIAQVGSMTYEIALRRTNPKATELSAPGVHELEIRWVTDVLDSSTGKLKTVSSKDIIKGIPKKLDGGTLENNKAQETNLSLEVIYFKHIQDGAALMEIDKLNNVLKINGTDYTKSIGNGL